MEESWQVTATRCWRFRVGHLGPVEHELREARMEVFCANERFKEAMIRRVKDGIRITELWVNGMSRKQRIDALRIARGLEYVPYHSLRDDHQRYVIINVNTWDYIRDPGITYNERKKRIKEVKMYLKLDRKREWNTGWKLRGEPFKLNPAMFASTWRKDIDLCNDTYWLGALDLLPDHDTLPKY